MPLPVLVKGLHFADCNPCKLTIPLAIDLGERRLIPGSACRQFRAQPREFGVVRQLLLGCDGSLDVVDQRPFRSHVLTPWTLGIFAAPRSASTLTIVMASAFCW